MKVTVVVCAILSVACGAAIYPLPATSVVRAPQFDSAVITSDRLGGNFAYSSHEAHAYAAVSPLVHNVITPVGISYTATPLQYPPVYPAVYPAYPGVPALIPSAPLYTPGAPIVPSLPVYPVAPEAPSAPAVPAPADAPAPADDAAPAEAAAPADSADPAPAASSDDSVTIEAA